MISYAKKIFCVPYKKENLFGLSHLPYDELFNKLVILDSSIEQENKEVETRRTIPNDEQSSSNMIILPSTKSLTN